MAVKLENLPFSLEALEPQISKKTIDLHYNKHHRHYVETVNKHIKDTPFDKLSLQEIILITAKNSDQSIFNNAAQCWNHEFMWKCLAKNGIEISKQFEVEIEKAFHSMASFKLEFFKQATEFFGSGWAWLVKDAEGGLKIRVLKNGDNPMTNGDLCLFVCDLWEHAYYLDYQNERAKYLENYWAVVNWKFVESNFERFLIKAST